MLTQGPLHSVGSAEFVEGLLRAGLATPAGAAEDLPKTTVLVEFDEQAEYSPLDKVRELEAQGCTVVVACRERSLPDAVLAVQAGASGILLKPVTASSLRQLPCADTEETAPAPEIDIAAWRAQYAPEMIGSSFALEQALAIAARAANCNCPVLITGENGTGKELLARALHRASSRAAAPFVAVNCPAIPKELVESELFGHTRGAFTGATVAREGRFAVADNGTLLLDEIGEMDLSIQSKLLRVLQDFQITRVGESRPQQVDVRILAATNRDLE